MFLNFTAIIYNYSQKIAEFPFYRNKQGTGTKILFLAGLCDDLPHRSSNLAKIRLFLCVQPHLVALGIDEKCHKTNFRADLCLRHDDFASCFFNPVDDSLDGGIRIEINDTSVSGRFVISQ